MRIENDLSRPKRGSISNRVWQRTLVLFAVLVVTCLSVSRTTAQDNNWLNTLANPEDQTAAAQAWKEFTSGASPSDLIAALEAMNEADPVGINWLSSAIDRIMESAAEKGQEIDVDAIERFLLDQSNAQPARLTAIDLVSRLAPERVEALHDRLLSDPVARLRKPGVAKQIEAAEALVEAKDESAKPTLHKILEIARDESQVQTIARLLGELEDPIVLAKHFGYVQAWQVAGPFPNPEGIGFETIYEPEAMSAEELAASLKRDGDSFDTKGENSGWVEVAVNEKVGDIDVAKHYPDTVEGVAYGAAIVNSSQEQDVQLRLRIQNAFKIWLNGELVMTQPIGHTGNFFDQYIVNAKLKPGANVLLVKSCQTSPIQDMAFFKVWHFGVRITDSTGAAILLEDDGT